MSYIFAGSEAEKMKVHLFPVMAAKEEINIADRYTNLLRTYLLQSDFFEIDKVEKFNNILEGKIEVFENVKSQITRFGLENNISTAIFGFIIKTGKTYKIRILLYSILYNDIIAEYADNLYDFDSIENSAKECAIKFAVKLNSIEGTRIFCASAFLPGFGQILMKRYVRGFLYMGAFGYFLLKNYSIEEKRYVKFMKFESIELEGATTIYLVNSKAYSYEEWRQKLEEYHSRKMEANDYNHNLEKSKKRYFIISGIIYVINIIDTLFLIDDYESREEVIKRLTVKSDFSCHYPKICLSFSF